MANVVVPEAESAPRVTPREPEHHVAVVFLPDGVGVSAYAFDVDDEPAPAPTPDLWSRFLKRLQAWCAPEIDS